MFSEVMTTYFSNLGGREKEKGRELAKDFFFLFFGYRLKKLGN